MRLGTWVLAAVACAAVWPAAAHAAAPLTADFTATDVGTNHSWYVTGTTSATTTTIAQHGTVSFHYPTGNSRHDVIFLAANPKPASCSPALTTTAQGSFVPAAGPTAPGWNASCTFDTPGTYSFQCQLHPTMRSTIVVSPADAGGDAGGTVPDVLAIGIGPAANLGQFLLGVAKDYTADVPATITSTMANATLTASDPSATATGHLLNGSYVMAQPLQIRATDAANPATSFGPLTSPATLLTWSGPVSNDNVIVSLQAADRRHGPAPQRPVREDRRLHAVLHQPLTLSRKLACLAALVAATALPALALGEPGRAPARINAIDYAFQSPDTGESTVTINAGDTVTFAYPTGTNVHNVVFVSGQPASCTLDGSGSQAAPLPSDPTSAGWSGSCRFTTPGTYEFVCGQHGFMTGTVEVLPGTATPTATATATATPTTTATATATATASASPTATATASPTATATATPTATASPTPTPTASPTATAAATSSPAPTAVPVATSAPTPAATAAPTPPGPAASNPELTTTQQGQKVKGTLTVARAASRIKVELRAKPSALGRKGSKPLLVGSATTMAPAGKATFTVNLNSTAKAALKRKGKLPVTVTITVTPQSGTPFTATATVTLKR